MASPQKTCFPIVSEKNSVRFNTIFCPRFARGMSFSSHKGHLPHKKVMCDPPKKVICVSPRKRLCRPKYVISVPQKKSLVSPQKGHRGPQKGSCGPQVNLNQGGSTAALISEVFCDLKVQKLESPGTTQILIRGGRGKLILQPCCWYTQIE